MSKRILILAVVTSMLAVSSVVAAEPTIVWQIGQVDHSFREFVNAGDLFGGYPRFFPQGVTFVVGQSDPAKDFTASHPGPLDQWAGGRQHPLRIRFDLPPVPDAAYELSVDLVDTQGQHAPTLRVAVNDQQTDVPLPTGAGDITAIHPDKGKAQSLKFFIGGADLKPQGNEIELTVIRGSWLLYDAITLRQLPADGDARPEVQLRPTLFLVERDGRLKQEFELTADRLRSREPLKIEVRAAGQVIDTVTLEGAVFGRLAGRLAIPATDVQRELTITAGAGGQSAVVTLVQKPIRKWHIFCAPSTHTDIGYTAHQDRVIELHNRNTDLALELTDQFPLYNWNLESSWAAQMWLRDKPRHQHDRLYAASSQRRMGIEASYLNMLTGLCSDEELVRTLYYSARLQREHGVPFKSYTLTDAPSHVWSVPSILAGAGIRCISIGSNQTRAPILKQNIHHKAPFWWEGPDGQRILTWITESYAQARLIGLSEGLRGMQQAIQRTMIWWDQREDYPYDAILLHGAYFDNVAIGRDIAESITEYSAHYAYPKVILCSNDAFFKHIEEHFADRIPTVRGCGGSWWEDGAASTALETGINRVAHHDLVAAEAAWAVVTGNSEQTAVPQEEFNAAWDNVLLFDEHTWGAHNSIANPTSDFVQRQWATKAAFATTGADQARRLLGDGLLRLAARVQAPDDAVLVFNPSGRPRGGMVIADLPYNVALLDDAGKPVPLQPIRSDVLDDANWGKRAMKAPADALETMAMAFRAEDVPAVGYRTYRMASTTTTPVAPARFKDGVLENTFYRICFDPAGGGIASIFDKRLGRELVDQASPHKLGQLIYAAGGKCEGHNWVHCPEPGAVSFSAMTNGRLEAGAQGPVYSSARIACGMEMFPRIQLETILYEHEPRVDFVFRLHKKMTYDKEAVYLAFPFAGSEPRFRYEIGAGNVRPNEDHWPGGCRDWFAVQRWVTLHTREAAVAWSAVDTPLVTLCDFTPGKWLDELPITNGTIFAYVMNNYWFTNYKAGQDDDFVFRYSLTSAQQLSPETASVFGEDVQAPLRAVRLFAGRERQDLPAAASFLAVEPADRVTLTVAKPADDGKGVIARLRETSGQQTEVVLTVRFPGAIRASLCDLVERVVEPLVLTDGQVKVPVRANGMATIRLEWDRPLTAAR
ncbi:MAG: hypothetical protein GXY55_20990 [Phycisphaerae bacterium]|nr:hypothetical protein [Phycisphaerae bacterium]